MHRLMTQLRETGTSYREVWHAPAFSAQRRAKYLRESGRRVAKSVLVIGDGEPVLALLQASATIDVDALKRLLGVRELRFANDRDIIRLFPDCAYGSIPGFGRPYRMPTVVDRRLLDEPYFIVPGTSWCTDYRMEPEEFRRMEQPISGEFSQPIRAAVSTIPKIRRKKI